MFKKQAKLVGWLLVVLVCSLHLVMAQTAAIKFDKQPDGITLRMPDYLVRVEVLSDSVVRVAAAKNKDFFTRNSIAVLPHNGISGHWTIAETPSGMRIDTARLQIQVDGTTGQVIFHDSKGTEILSEVPGSRKLEAASVEGENSFHRPSAGMQTGMSASTGSASNS